MREVVEVVVMIAMMMTMAVRTQVYKLLKCPITMSMMMVVASCHFEGGVGGDGGYDDNDGDGRPSLVVAMVTFTDVGPSIYFHTRVPIMWPMPHLVSPLLPRGFEKDMPIKVGGISPLLLPPLPLLLTQVNHMVLLDRDGRGIEVAPTTYPTCVKASFG